MKRSRGGDARDKYDMWWDENLDTPIDFIRDSNETNTSGYWIPGDEPPMVVEEIDFSTSLRHDSSPTRTPAMPRAEAAAQADEPVEDDELNDMLRMMIDAQRDEHNQDLEGPPLDEEEEDEEEVRGYQHDLDDFYEEEDEDADGSQEDLSAPGPMHVVIERNYDKPWLDAKYIVGGGEGKVGASSYERPYAAALDANASDLIFQHTETTYGIDREKQIPELRIWGVTADGNSVLFRDQHYKPYFYAHISNDAEAGLIRTKLDTFLGKDAATSAANANTPAWLQKKKQLKTYVLSIEPVLGRSICGWHRNLPLQRMYKFTMAHPSHVAKARNCLEFGNPAVCNHPYKTYEANVPFELRCMIDARINGCEWIRAKAGAYKVVHDDDKISNAQYELFTSDSGACDPIPASEKGDLAPMRYLSYDIEVLRKKRGFPTPKEDPVILICAALNVTGKGIVHKAVFALAPSVESVREHIREQQEEEEDEGSSLKRRKGVPWFKEIDDATVYVYKEEWQLLMAFSKYVQDCDPEALTGWNTTDFDLPFLAGRAKAQGCFNEFMLFSRILGKKVYIRQKTFQSKAHGAKVSNEMLCEGRFEYDGLTFMLRGQMEKYRSYKLNYISHLVVGDQKVDVDYTQIPTLYEGDDEDRTRLAWYCLKDALLPLQILEKLMAVVNGIEQARVTGVPIKWLLARGQGVKTFSNILRYKMPEEHTPSRTPKTNTAVTGGGYVKEPKRGYYLVPLASLDFASLYPSIMIAYNLCYSTKENLAWARAINPATGLPNLDPKDYWVPYPAIDKKTDEQLAEEKAQVDMERAAGIKRKKKNKKEREREALEADYAGVEPDFCFVKRHVRQGVLPLLLETLLKTRANVKNMMKSVNPKTDPLYYSVLDGRQLALKVVCNSVYGFLKAFILTDKDLMAAVTSYGRNMIYRVNKIIKESFADNDVVDCPKCRELGIDPEVPMILDGIDIRPRTRTKAFVVYGDTDSVMVNFGDVTLEDCARLGALAAKMCTEAMEPPNSLAFESVKLRSIYLNKKRYASLEILKVIPGEHMRDAIKRAKVSIKGLEGKRRDNAPIGSDTQNEVIEILLKEADIAKAENHVKQVIEDLLMDRVDMSKLVISKGLSKTEEQYEKGGTKQQHVELQKRMRKRAKYTGEAVPETGDRVPFIMRAGVNKKGADKASDLAEDPSYAQKHGIPISLDYYIHKQIWPA